MAETTPPIIIEDDDLCPICQLLLFTPVRTKCNHLLCSSCFAQWADISSATNIAHSSLDVNLSDFGPNYDPAYDLEANCPMCRTHTAAAADTKLARQLEKKYPTTYAERKEEEEIERGSKTGEDGVEGVMILIGNKHRIVRDADDANVHDWNFFVRTSRPEIVEEVRINLHPTFRPPRVVRRQPPFEVHRRGWGIFEIQAEIVLKEPYSWVKDRTETRHPGLKLAWTLDFEGRGRQGRLRTKVRKLTTHTVEAAQDQDRAASPVNWPHMDQDDYE